jgi:tRNA G18 (ribose-2'-O)-methylase SpoU
MITKSGYCGIGIFHSKSTVNVGTLWRSAYNFDIDFIFTVGRRYDRQPSDTLNTPKHIPLFRYRDLSDLIAHLPFGCTLVGVELHENAQMLPFFTHPKQACYLLGAEDFGLSKEALEKCHKLVQIPHAFNCLNVATAGSIVLYDRGVKTYKEEEI